MTNLTDNPTDPSESLSSDAWAYPKYTEGHCPYGCGERVVSLGGEWHHRGSGIVDAECQKEGTSQTMTNTTREIIENDIRAAFDNAILIGADPAAVLAILQQMVEDEAQFQSETAAYDAEVA